ncbi:hypothetical protein [Paenibacillus rigui]|uniref:hypothetical protein n=1 Tax=Paenibacillus rigui TaxID=554312 RepID=UPI00117E0636|nr:hypothetical protein [Paenibacillus rigui]
MMIMNSSSGQGVILPWGILFDGHFYSCSRAIQEQWFSSASRMILSKVKVYFFPCYRDIIQIELNNRKTIITCYVLSDTVTPLKNRQKYYKQLQRLQQRYPRKRRMKR